jgi:hypothetical protein
MPEAIATYVADYFAFEVIGTTVAAAAAIETAVTIAATVAINQVASKVLSSSSGSGGTAAPGVLSATVRQSDASRRLIYGRTRVGGVMVYPQQDPDGKVVRVAVYLGEGPVAGIDSTIWIGDELSSESKFDDLVELETRLGTPGQTAVTTLVTASAGEWTAADVGTGCAYAVVRLGASREAFPRGRVNMPMSFMVSGRVCFDPRTSTAATTSNPALCLLDFMRSEYGPDGGIADDLIDFDSFAAAASVCDELVDSIDPANVVGGTPGKVRRYTLDGVFEVSAGHTAIKETMERAMAGKMLMVGGKYRCFPGAWRAPTGPVLTAHYLRGAPTFRTHQQRTQRINTARGTYREPRQDWQNTDFNEQQLPAAVVAEDGEIVQTMDFPATTNGATAQRLAKLAMLQARSAVPLVLPCNWAVFQWQEQDVVTLDLPQVGASGTWLISGYKFVEGGGIDLTLVPHLASDFAWNPATDERTVTTVVAPSFNSAPLSVAGLVVVGSALVESGSSESTTTTSYGLRATWTASSDYYLRHYRIEYKRSTATTWIDGGTVGDVSSPLWERAVSTGYEYDVRVRIRREDGTDGPWSTETNILVSGDTTAPGVPTALSVTGTGTHTVGWTNPTSLDVMRARVYASATNNPTTATEVAEVFGLPATAYTATHTPAGVPTYYWVTAVDRSGNESARTAAGTGN